MGKLKGNLGPVTEPHYLMSDTIFSGERVISGGTPPAPHNLREAHLLPHTPRGRETPVPDPNEKQPTPARWGGGLARARFGNRAQGAVDRETVSGSAPPLTLSSLRRSRSRAALMRRWDCWCSCATCCSPSACSWCWAFCTTPPGSCTSSAGRTPVSTGAVPPRCPARSPSRRPGVGGTRRSPTGRGAVGARKGWSSASPDALGGFAFITGYESRLAPRVSSVTAAGPWGSLL